MGLRGTGGCRGRVSRSATDQPDAIASAPRPASPRRARRRLGGRPRKLTDPKQLELARTLYAGGQTDIATICATLGISRATLYRTLKGQPAER